MVRFIYKLEPRSHIGAVEISGLGWLNVQYRVAQLKLNHMHNVFYQNCPEYLLSMFTFTHNVHSHRTRNSVNSFFVPRYSGINLKSFNYTGVKLWNSLPSHIRSTEGKTTFRKKLKDHLKSEMLGIDNNDFVYY